MAKWVCNVQWQDVPHISPEKRAEYEASYLPHEREARTKGFPAIGSGKIFPIPESDFVVAPFRIPEYWPRVYSLDVGFKRTCALWGALDPDNGVWYVYNEYYSAREEPPVHAAAILKQGKWIPGVIDPSSMRGNERDGRKLMNEYRDLGLDPLYLADNSVEVGILRILTALSAGKLKVFINCQNLIAEYRIYRYDENGRVARNQEDHAMDALRYLVNTGHKHCEPPPDEFGAQRAMKSYYRHDRDEITGC